jgi:hypothetical protein
VARLSQTPAFRKDWARLDGRSRTRFEALVRERFVPDLASGRFRAGLRVKRVQRARQVWELTWAPDGRATWEYAKDSVADDPHVIFRRIGTHDVLRAP